MKLMNFNYNDHEVRTITQDGEPWFVASDICEYFGVTNRTRTLQVVDPQDKGGTRTETPGGEQTVTIINESGLYDAATMVRPLDEDEKGTRQTRTPGGEHWGFSLRGWL